jgi:hypothetical protein
MIFKKYIRAAEPKMKNLQIINLQKNARLLKKKSLKMLLLFQMNKNDLEIMDNKN